MKAAVYTKYGPPEVVQVTTVEKPVPEGNEVLVRVRASSVNRTDDGFLRAAYFLPRFFNGLIVPKKPILGCEFAGEVEVVGKDVTQFKVGDKVFGYDDAGWGGHAEYKTIAEDAMIAAMPTNVSFEQAAVSTEGAHYALNNLRKTGVQKGSKVLVYGATGAIGSAAVQLAKHFGAEVTAVCAGRHVALVQSLGADKVVDYETEDFTNLATRFDVIFDAVGKSSFRACKPLLASKGTYVSTELGYGGQNPFLALVTPLFGGKKVAFPIPGSRKEDAEFLKELMESGEYLPVIDRSYRLDDIVAAYKYVETGQKVGNVVISLG